MPHDAAQNGVVFVVAFRLLWPGKKWKARPPSAMQGWCEAVARLAAAAGRQRKLCLMGFSRGAMWAEVWTRAMPAMIHRTVLGGWYPDPAEPKEDLERLARSHTSICMVNGRRDKCCPAETTTFFAQALMASSVSNQVLTLDGGHEDVLGPSCAVPGVFT